MWLTPNRLLTGLFCILLLGAAFFWLERGLFADASFILFRIVNSGALQIQEGRYGSFITQAVPLLASQAGLPLPVIVFLYSASFNLFYLAVVLLLLRRKELPLAVLMSFYFLLFVSDTFFWMNNEVHQAMAWMFLLFAATFALGKRKASWLVALPVFGLLAFLTLFTHPLLLLPVSYLWLFFTARSNWPCARWQTILFTLCLAGLAIARWTLSTGPASHYDVEKLAAVQRLSFVSVAAALTSPMAGDVLKRVVTDYWVALLLLITGLVATLKAKAYWPFLLTIGYTFGYFVAVCTTFNSFTPFYTESELMPATVILTAPFVYYALPLLNEKRQAAILATIFAIRLAYIGTAAPRWVERKEWVLNTLETMRQQQVSKAVIKATAATRDRLQLTWGTPAESLIASALRGDRPQLTFVVVDSTAGAELPAAKNKMMASFEILMPEDLNTRYFAFDTTTHYTVFSLKQ